MSFEPSKRRHASPDLEGEPLNLIPIMNLLTILIPFLTLSAVFMRLAVLPTTLPSSDDSAEVAPEKPEEKDEEDKEKLNLTVSIIKDGFVVAGAGGVLGNQKNDGGPTIPKKDGQYDFEGLTTKLIDIKKKYPEEKDAILIPEMNLKGEADKIDIPYQVIIDTMDAIRGAPEDVVDSDGDGKLDRILFPGVIFSPGIL